MASALASDILTAVHKHYSVEVASVYQQFFPLMCWKHVMVSTGVSDADFRKKLNRFST